MNSNDKIENSNSSTQNYDQTHESGQSQSHSFNWTSVDEDTPEFSFENQNIVAKVVSVYDGDTIKVVFPLHETLYKWNCRLTGVDTPEIRTRCDIEKKYGYKVRDCLRDRILNKLVTLKCGEFDKYGRLLIEIYCDDMSNCTVNRWLIDNNYAFEYDGGTKKSWKEYLETEEGGKEIASVSTPPSSSPKSVFLKQDKLD